MSDITLTASDNNTSREVKVGTPVSLQLAEIPGTGYRWTLDTFDDTLLSQAGSEFVQTPGSGVGGGGVRMMTFLAKSPGVAKLSLKNKRPWEADAAAVGQFEVTLTITQ